MDTENQATEQGVQAKAPEVVAPTEPAVEAPTPEPKVKTPEPVQETPSIRQERQYSQPEVSKMQSTFEKKIQRLKQENRLAQAAIQSRIAKPVDPMDPSTQAPTPEELAHRKYVQDSEAEERAEAEQSQREQGLMAFRDSLHSTLRRAGIEPTSKEAMDRVGLLYQSGDYEGARTEAAAMIAEKRLEAKLKPKEKPVDPIAESRKKAKEEGGFVTGGSTPSKPVSKGKKPSIDELRAATPWEYDKKVKSGEWVV